MLLLLMNLKIVSVVLFKIVNNSMIKQKEFMEDSFVKTHKYVERKVAKKEFVEKLKTLFIAMVVGFLLGALSLYYLLVPFLH